MDMLCVDGEYSYTVEMFGMQTRDDNAIFPPVPLCDDFAVQLD
jgi:hypothetical protein